MDRESDERPRVMEMRKLGTGKVCSLLTMLGLLAACTGGDSSSPTASPGADRPTTSSEASPSAERPQDTDTAEDAEPTETPSGSQPSPDETAVLDAYQGYWGAILDANDPPDPTHPALERYATGPAYESVFEAAQTNRLANRALRLPEDAQYEHQAEVVSIEGDTATVRDCSIDDLLVVNTETDEVVNDAVVTRLSIGTLVREDERWKVANSEVERRWEGVAGCAVE